MFIFKKNNIRNSLILAIESDDLIKFNKNTYEHKYSSEILKEIFRHQAIKILKEYQNYYFLLSLDEYGTPYWWNAFETKITKNTLSMISFLKNFNVNFDQLNKFGVTISYELLSSYKYENLKILLYNNIIDVNAIHRIASKSTLLHAMASLDDHRYRSFLKEGDCVTLCLDYIQKNGDQNLKDKSGMTYLDLIVRSNFWQLANLSVKLSKEQETIVYLTKNSVSVHKEVLNEKNKHLFPFIMAKIVFNDFGIIQVDSTPYYRKDSLENNVEFINLSNLSEKTQIKLPCGSSYVYVDTKIQKG